MFVPPKAGTGTKHKPGTIDGTAQFFTSLERQKEQVQRRLQAPRIIRPGEAPSWAAHDDDEHDDDEVTIAPSTNMGGGHEGQSGHYQGPYVGSMGNDQETARFVAQIVGSGTHSEQAITEEPVFSGIIVDASAMDAPTDESSTSTSNESTGLSRREQLRLKMLAKQRGETGQDFTTSTTLPSTKSHETAPSTIQVTPGAQSHVTDDRRQVREGNEEVEEEDAEEEEEEEEEEDDDLDEDEDEDVYMAPKLVRPVFMSRKDRLKALERAGPDVEEEAEKWAEERRSERVEESRKLAEEYVKRDIEAEARLRQGGQAGVPEVMDEIETFEIEEMKWRIREIERLKRDEEERSKFEREEIERERRKKMTPAEREAEDREREREMIRKKEEEKQKRMESDGRVKRYYSKGAFFMTEDYNEDGLFNRDFSVATGKDREIDVRKLPKHLQHRGPEGGKIKTSKWQGLSAEDTSTKDSLWRAAEKDKDRWAKDGDAAKARELARIRRNEREREHGGRGNRDETRYRSRSRNRSRSRSRSRGR